jgi:hypothetical protein
MHSMGLIVPYRNKNRQKHLDKFVNHITKCLTCQNIVFKIYVIAQDDYNEFNQGILSNIGFLLAQNNHDYFVFHDVEIPSVDLNYEFQSSVTFLNEKVVLIDKDNFIKMNGFNNDFWGQDHQYQDLIKETSICGLNSIKYEISHTQNKNDYDIFSVRI